MIKKCVCGKIASTPTRAKKALVTKCACGRIYPVNNRRLSDTQREAIRNTNSTIYHNERLAREQMQLARVEDKPMVA